MAQWYAWGTKGDLVEVPVIPWTGTWENGLDSTMKLKVENGTVSGTYRTEVGAPGNFEEFEMIGTTTGDLISWTVNWGRYGSITSWVGQHTADAGGGNERIVALWQLVKNVAEGVEKENIWGSVLTGAGTFSRI